MFTRRGDAVAFERDVERRRQLGPLASQVMESKMTLAEFVRDEWFPRYAIPNLAPDTRRRYVEVWDHDLRERLGGYPLQEIAPGMVEDLRDQLARAGLSVASQRKALLLLSGILKRAAVRELIPRNPVSMIAMPKAPPSDAPQPLSPLTVERIRQIMLSPRTRTVPATAAGKRPQRGYSSPVGSPLERQRNALIVSMLAYGGLRPIEDRGAHWADLRERTLHVFASKTGRPRDIDLLSPLAQDLAEWRLARGRPGEHELIIPRPTGGEWTRSDWGNWRNRVWRPAAIAAGVSGDMRPYRLRGSFVSLLLWSGLDLVDVAEQAGHSVSTLSRNYAGVMRELKGQPRIPAADAIRQAREEAGGQLRLVAR
ncbi:MAG: tyrosine-type recombinase/integrase [Solirubrobacteraceae bacterium]